MPCLTEAVWQYSGELGFFHQHQLPGLGSAYLTESYEIPMLGMPGPPRDGQSGSMVASGSSRIGIPLRMGYTRWHSLHFRASSPRSTSGLRHTGQASISSRSGLIMVTDFSRILP